MSKMTIKPELPGGFRDYLPQDMIPRQKMLDTIRSVFERFGFDPLQTPTIERLDVLTGNNEFFNMHLFRTGVVRGLNEPHGSQFNETAVRFDLTVPLSRVIAANSNLPKPFKRYQVGTVCRGEKPQAGRFREFTQFDADIVGSSSILADTEIILIMCESMKALGFENSTTRFNSRKILNGLAQLVGFDSPDERTKEVFRILDKLEKIGWNEVKEKLQRQPKNSSETDAPNLNNASVDMVKEFLNIKGTSNETLAQLRELFKSSPLGSDGVDELSEIVENLMTMDIPEGRWKLDLSIARGLDYYTGPVFETVLNDAPEIGSVFGGGRYDGLVSRFQEDANIPATGASLGVDRLFAAMKKLDKVHDQKTTVEVLVANFEPKAQEESIKLAATLRRVGINTELYYGSDTSLTGQLRHAVKKEVPFLAFIG